MSDTDSDDETEVATGGGADLFTDCVTRIVCAYLQHNPGVPIEKLGEVITTVSTAIVGDGASTSDDLAGEEQVEDQRPAVPIKRSLTDEHLVCLECGEQRTTLKLHLERRHDLSPHQYREKWGLDAEYPMTAPAYGRKRSAECKARGFGKKKGAAE